MTISDLKPGDIFILNGNVYKLIRFWLEDGLPWQYHYQNILTKEHAISDGKLYIEERV